MTGLANGQICVLYSPNTSINGAKLLLNKGPPRKATIEDMSDALAAPTIITPHALPMFRDGDIARGTKRKREKDRMDPRKSKRPELPVTGPGKGGRVGASATQHVVQNLVRDTTRDEDVRIISLCRRSVKKVARDQAMDLARDGHLRWWMLLSMDAGYSGDACGGDWAVLAPKNDVGAAVDVELLLLLDVSHAQGRGSTSEFWFG